MEMSSSITYDLAMADALVYLESLGKIELSNEAKGGISARYNAWKTDKKWKKSSKGVDKEAKGMVKELAKTGKPGANAGEPIPVGKDDGKIIKFFKTLLNKIILFFSKIYHKNFNFYSKYAAMYKNLPDVAKKKIKTSGNLKSTIKLDDGTNLARVLDGFLEFLKYQNLAPELTSTPDKVSIIMFLSGFSKFKTPPGVTVENLGNYIRFYTKFGARKSTNDEADVLNKGSHYVIFGGSEAYEKEKYTQNFKEVSNTSGVVSLVSSISSKLSERLAKMYIYMSQMTEIMKELENQLSSEDELEEAVKKAPNAQEIKVNALNALTYTRKMEESLRKSVEGYYKHLTGAIDYAASISKNKAAKESIEVEVV